MCYTSYGKGAECQEQAVSVLYRATALLNQNSLNAQEPIKVRRSDLLKARAIIDYLRNKAFVVLRVQRED